MRHRKGTKKLGRHTAHRLSLYRNLITELIRHERIVTTEAKAKAVRGLAERVITWGKEGTVPARRRALNWVWDKKVLDKVFNELARRYADRPGGYTRVVKLGRREGDGAPMARLELVE